MTGRADFRGQNVTTFREALKDRNLDKGGRRKSSVTE
jgi:hypothetical protein